MPKSIPEEKLQAIEAVVSGHAEGITIHGIEDAMGGNIPRRTLQFRLKRLVEEGRIVKEGKTRWVKYRPPGTASPTEARSHVLNEVTEEPVAEIAISRSAAEIRNHVRKPIPSREPVGYDRKFLDAYRPNVTAYLSVEERAHLKKVGTPATGEQPAGTYARQMLSRLLIDLSWNSSRLEGNTYSLLDTKRLIEYGDEAEGKERLEAQMILNHKDAIELLVSRAEEIGFNRYTILNLHGLLANNLLTDPAAAGRLRRIAVGIAQSVFHPLEVPQLIEECFDDMLDTAEAIEDPFEQVFFVLVQLPYLQPFDDVNKRVSRLAANIPLIKSNLIPLSFIDVPASTYTEAMLGIYELNRIELLKDLFLWAYDRSASRYTAVRQSLGEPDPFRIKHRTALREIVRLIVLEPLNRKAAFRRIAAWAEQHIEAGDRELFRQLAENELLSLHEGNFARYRIRPSRFSAWQAVWN